MLVVGVGAHVGVGAVVAVGGGACGGSVCKAAAVFPNVISPACSSQIVFMLTYLVHGISPPPSPVLAATTTTATEKTHTF